MELLRGLWVGFGDKRPKLRIVHHEAPMSPEDRKKPKRSILSPTWTLRNTPSLGFFLTLSIKIAQKPYIMGSLGPKALKYESFEGKGNMSAVYKSSKRWDFRSRQSLYGAWNQDT